MQNFKRRVAALEKVTAVDDANVRVVFCEPGETTAEARIRAGVAEGRTLLIQFGRPEEQSQ